MQAACECSSLALGGARVALACRRCLPQPAKPPAASCWTLCRWLSYVATLELASELSGGSGLALSAVVLIRFLPSLLLAPVCGVVADRWGGTGC